MLHGPVVVAPPGSPPEDAVEVAGRLVADALEQAQADGIDTVFARPQSLDRVWVRSGFIPIPEAELPHELRAGPALGSSAGAAAPRSGAPRGAAAPARPRPRRHYPPSSLAVKIVALAGGTGAAKLLRGLARFWTRAISPSSSTPATTP